MKYMQRFRVWWVTRIHGTHNSQRIWSKTASPQNSISDFAMSTSAGFNWNCSKIQGLWDVQQKSRCWIFNGTSAGHASSLGISEGFNWNLQIFMIGFDMLTSAKKNMFSFEALISVPEGLRFPKVSDETFRNFPFSDPNSKSGKKTYFFFRPQINAR